MITFKLDIKNFKKVLAINDDDFQNNKLTIDRLKTLPFYFKEGACGSFSEQDGKEFALLCFDREDPTTCYKCTDLRNATETCLPINSKPSNDVSRNAIRLGKYQGRTESLSLTIGEIQ